MTATPRRLVASHGYESAYWTWRFGILFLNGVRLIVASRCQILGQWYGQFGVTWPKIPCQMAAKKGRKKAMVVKKVQRLTTGHGQLVGSQREPNFRVVVVLQHQKSELHTFGIDGRVHVR